MRSSDLEKTLLRIMVCLLAFLSGMYLFLAGGELLAGNWGSALLYTGLVAVFAAGAGLWVYLLRELRHE